MLLTLSGRSFIKIQYSSFPLFPVAYPFRIATQLQFYVKREKCKVNDVIFPSGCEARAINLGNKNMKIGIFTGCTSVRSKNIFIDIFRYPTGKHEIKENIKSSSKNDIFQSVDIQSTTYTLDFNTYRLSSRALTITNRLSDGTLNRGTV